MQQQLIAVNELPPRLSGLRDDWAREFIRLYESYEARATDPAMIVPMRFCLEPSDVEELLREAEDWDVQVAPAVAQAAHQGGLAHDLGAEPGPRSGENEEEASDDGVTVPEVPPMARLSNLHIRVMLKTVLGPRSVDESGYILASACMPASSSYSHMTPARDYVQRWKRALDWCAAVLPASKWLTRTFAKELQNTLWLLGERQILPVMDAFLAQFPVKVNATRTLTIHRIGGERGFGDAGHSGVAHGSVVHGGGVHGGGGRRDRREGPRSRPTDAFLSASVVHTHEQRRAPPAYTAPVAAATRAAPFNQSGRGNGRPGGPFASIATSPDTQQQE